MRKYHSRRTNNENPPPPQQYECGILDKKGEMKLVIVNVSLIGKERIVSLTDITDRKRAELEREQLEAQLQQALKMEAIGTLAGGIAHDFNNILSAILGYADLVIEDMSPEDSSWPMMEEIYSSGMRARDLVAQILAFSRKDEQASSPVDLHLIVKETLKLLRPAIPATIDIRTKLDSKCRIKGDPSRLHQVIVNLCTNAYLAMLETGGTLNIVLSSQRLKGEAAIRAGLPPGDYGKLVVSDTGAGIPPENIDRIFEPYFTTKEKGKGTGLGLSAVHGIVKSHNGSISVKSRSGEGTVFEVYLPLTMESNADKRIDRVRSQGRNERILLVDDEPSILGMGRQMLTRLGYDTTVAGNAREAVELFAEHSGRFDLVISDMTMPGMTGDKLAGELRKMAPGIPILLCTGFSGRTFLKKVESLKINGFIAKPFLRDDLAETVRKVLDDASGDFPSTS